jgi:hypothetical protein
MDEKLDPSDQELIEDAIDPTPAAQKRLEGLAERIGLTFEEQRIFVLEFEASIFEAQLSAVGAEFGFTSGQQAIFTPSFGGCGLRFRCERRSWRCRRSISARTPYSAFSTLLRAFGEPHGRNLCRSADCSLLKRRTGSPKHKLSLTNCENGRGRSATSFWSEA